ncbi:type II secretion system F family protein [Dechloromonas denitrificans]|uniref:type II secretion system F family protein n=1 Tax=Dechloromonas denitrificans TaxID=281362 RepID=UPI001CF7ECE9|nr:type II secretion system F family protein [Dechloromonas denitrificans]UCV03333.1 type II secretion system F family protein [Dechloromonas denitrificans]
MQRFKIKAFRPGSGICTLTIEAVDGDGARAAVVAQGLSVLDVSASTLTFGSGSGRAKFPLIFFNQELSALLTSGFPLLEALEALAEKEQNRFVHGVIGRLVARLREGLPLSSAMAEAPEVFPLLYVASVRAAERTSDLEGSLERYIAYQRQLETIRNRLISAAAYPLILIAVGGLVVMFLLGYVVPRFSHIFEDIGGDLPLMSRLLLSWGQFAEKYALVVASGLALSIVGLSAVLQRKDVRAWLVRQVWALPWFGERLRVYQLSRFYRTFGMLLLGGIPVIQALELVKGLLSQALQAKLLLATASIRAGGLVSEAMTVNGLTTPMAYRMLRVGERSGGMGVMMERIASFHEEEMARLGEWFGKLIGPALMLLMGLLIGGIVVVMYLPIFQLAESIH